MDYHQISVIILEEIERGNRKDRNLNSLSAIRLDSFPDWTEFDELNDFEISVLSNGEKTDSDSARFQSFCAYPPDY